jgi:glycosyltransferase involved in cell wall biosynthesis
MTQLGARPALAVPTRYKDFELVRSHGRYYGVPDFLDPEEALLRNYLTTHPAIPAASSLEELRAVIDGFDARAYLPEPAGSYAGYDLLRHRGAVYGVPRAAGRVDLNLEEERRHPGILRGVTAEEVRERIRTAQAAVPVEFAGWLPIFEFSGNCGRHPQFKHTAEPPAGYRFSCSGPLRRPLPAPADRGLAGLFAGVCRVVLALWAVLRPLLALFRPGAGCSLRGRLRVLAAIVRLYVTLRRSGGRLIPVLRFLQSRHFQSQLLLGDYRGLVFLTSMPYTYGQNPWVLEIEDPTTLFYPLIQNGGTFDLDLARSPYFPIVKALLESDQCKGILTHMRSTARMVPTLFGSEIIRKKVSYAPLGVPLPGRWQRHAETEHVNLVFINSWCQVPSNFCLRGGLDVLEAFGILRERYPQLRLTLRTHLPGLAEHYHHILERGWVRVIDRFLAADEMDRLLAESHIFLLPAARVHIVSLLQAMSYGLAVVASDGWGIAEYIDHERNGVIVKGRYGKVSWADEEAGLLREDYDPMGSADPVVVQGLVEAVSRLVEDRRLRRRLGLTARRDVQTQYSLEGWNRALKQAFDRALSSDTAPGPVVRSPEVVSECR